VDRVAAAGDSFCDEPVMDESIVELNG